MQHELLIVGLNHRTASVEIRERLAFADERLDAAHQELIRLPAVNEAALISTCNRVEIVACTRDPEQAVGELVQFLRRAPGDEMDVESHLYTYRERQSVRHLFRVAASLDSMVVGEPQILGQLKEHYTRASSTGATGPILHRLFHRAFSVAKRVRSETGVASRAVSVSSAAVQLASSIFDRLDDKTAMLIGAGRMGELAARHLLSRGVGSLILTNRTFDRAVELARDLNATPVPFEQFPRYLPMADIVIGSTGADEFILVPGLVQEAIRERKGRPMFCIDLGVPRNFDPQINEMANVYLYDVDDLSSVAEENLGERAQEALRAEDIVQEEVAGFCRWLAELQVVPTIVALREHVEAIRAAELEKTLHAAVLRDVSPETRQALEAMTAAIVKKILHAPITCLKAENHRSEAYYVDAARRLFRLGSEEDTPGEEE